MIAANLVDTVPVITRADDFGVSPGTNDAILECLDAGFIRNVGVMAPGPYLEHRLDELVARQSECCVGLHATLTSEWRDLRWGPVAPASRRSGLVRSDGTFHQTTVELYTHASLDEMMAEIEAQIAWVQQLGLRLRYLDSHMNFLWIEGIQTRLADLCAKEEIVFAAAPRFVSRKSPVAMVTSTIAQREEWEKSVVQNPAATSVWVFHPAKRDAVSEKFFGYGPEPVEQVAQKRHREYLELIDRDAMATLCQDWHVQPVCYGE